MIQIYIAKKLGSINNNAWKKLRPKDQLEHWFVAVKCSVPEFTLLVSEDKYTELGSGQEGGIYPFGMKQSQHFRSISALSAKMH